MKRFFPTVQRDASTKKLATADTLTGIPLPQSLAATDGDPLPVPTSSDDCDQPPKDPLRFMSWNANSFILRLRNNREELVAFLHRIDPHVIAIQVAAIILKCNRNNFSSFSYTVTHEVSKSKDINIGSSWFLYDYTCILLCAFRQAHFLFDKVFLVSAAHSENCLQPITWLVVRIHRFLVEVRIPAAGRKGEPKNQGEMKDDTKAARDDKQFMTQTLSRPPFASYKVWWSLADTKYGGTALLVRKGFEPLSVRYSLDRNGNKHETDGRVILAEFSGFYLMNTYVPNNGWKEEELSFQRRRKWDQRILDFIARKSGKPLIWCGDLNVSHEDIDVSHPEFFRNAKLQGYIPPNTEDMGQPGFTQAERDRFAKILKEAQWRSN